MQEKEMLITKNRLLGIILGALIIGFVVGFAVPTFFLTTPQIQVMQTSESQNLKLSDEDKNFLVNIANSQVQLTTLQNDWCVRTGGIWNETTTQAEIELDQQRATELQQQGAQVTQRDGKFYVITQLIKRDGCILISAQQ